MGSHASFRASKLWDPTDALAPKIQANIAKWNSFFKKYRAPRPSGSSGVLTSAMIHLSRPDSRSLEVTMHVTSDTSAADRAIAGFANPTRASITKNATLPLYYSGLKPGTKVTVKLADLGKNTDRHLAKLLYAPHSGISSHTVGGDGGGFTDIVVPITVPAASYAATC